MYFTVVLLSCETPPVGRSHHVVGAARASFDILPSAIFAGVDRRVRTYPQRPMSLASLPPLLRDEPALTGLLGHPDAVVAVPEAARPIAIAALSRLSRRDARWSSPARPAPTPASSTTTSCSSCRRARSCCSPRGRRCRSNGSARAWRRWAAACEVLWRLRDPERCPAIIVAGVRALLQRLGPGATDVEPIVVRPGDVIDPDELLRRARATGLSPRGAGRAPRRGRPARRDHRRLPVDRRRADPHRPVGRRGRPADRVRRQRPAQHRRPRRGADLPGAAS